MREILFRGKTTVTKRWVEGLLWRKHYKGNPFICYFPDEDDNEEAVRVDPATVCQYTGLIDKNGKKIFEGDVVAQNWYDHEEPTDSSFGKVVFCEYDCSFSVMDVEEDGIVPLGRCHAFYWEVEVIGNIFDNPELMKGGVSDEKGKD